MATAVRPRLVLLRESIAGTNGRVDRERAVIYGVKVLGRKSSNGHGVPGADATEYTDAALQEAARQYEGIRVNADHPPRKDRSQERSALDRVGWLENARVEQGGVYADLHLLNTHPLTPRLLEAAERNPRLFGLSHNAWGRGEVKNGRYIVNEIPEVRSVDIVADGGTVTSLFESNHMATKTVRQVLESLLGSKHKARLRPLLEMGYGDDEEAKLMEQPVDDAGMAPMPEAPPADLQGALGAAVMACYNDPSMDKAAKRKKIIKLLDLAEDEAPAETAPVEEQDEMDDEEEDRPMEESRKSQPHADPQVRLLQEEVAALRREKECRELCESQGVALKPAQFKALCLLESKDDRKAFLSEHKSVDAGRRPRTQPLRESQGSDRGSSVKDFVARLTGRN